jgi:hypothetical protein
MTTCGCAQVSIGGQSLPRKFSTTVANRNSLAKALTALGAEDIPLVNSARPANSTRDVLNVLAEGGGTTAVALLSKIRLVGPRHVSVLSRVPLDVLCARLFQPGSGVIATASISHRRGPWRRKYAPILDRELELQVLAAMVRVPHPLRDVMFLCIP